MLFFNVIMTLGKEEKAMLDIKLIRENPEKINELLKRRNPDLSIDEVIKIEIINLFNIKSSFIYFQF